MYNLVDTARWPIIPILYFTSIVFLCSFFIINLLLAVILESYTQHDANFAKNQLEKYDEERQKLENLLEENYKR